MAVLVEAVLRATTILDLLGEAPDGMHITDIAKKLGLPKGSVYRVLATLGSQGYVQKDSETSKYYLGVKILQLQGNIVTRSNMVAIAIPHINRLALEVKEVVHLAALNRDRVVYLESRRPEHALSSAPSLGHVAPAYCSALGKVLLAYQEPGDLPALLANMRFEQLTANTITTAEALQQELERVRRRGYGVDDEEMYVGVRCIAGPIFDHRERVVAALSISAPPQRMPKSQDGEVAAKVLATCRRISEALGARRMALA